MRQAGRTNPVEIEIREVSEPDLLAKNEIKLKIHRIGVCGSDMHVYHGRHPFTSHLVV